MLSISTRVPWHLASASVGDVGARPADPGEWLHAVNVQTTTLTAAICTAREGLRDMATPTPVGGTTMTRRWVAAVPDRAEMSPAQSSDAPPSLRVEHTFDTMYA